MQIVLKVFLPTTRPKALLTLYFQTSPQVLMEINKSNVQSGIKMTKGYLPIIYAIYTNWHTTK